MFTHVYTVLGFFWSICLLQSNAFDVTAPHTRDYHRWRASTRTKNRFQSYGQSCMITRCGGAADENFDATKKAVGDKRSPFPIAVANWYMNQLETHELRTKFLSSAILALVGDVCAQNVGHFMINRSSGGSGSASLALDKRRMMAMFVDGFFCTGPLLHYVYELYEWVLPTHDDGMPDTKIEENRADDSDQSKSASKKRFLAVLAHVLFDNFVMVTVYIAVLMVSTALLEGRRNVIPKELKYDLIPAVKVSWGASVMGVAPLQLLSFHYLPRKLRVLAVNVLDVVWITVMSFVTHRNRH
mmetsp:Transcript_41364/g.86833  ORF Transcript_41364/g.86833 Transcript_41364/m.86833 type:complete len:299 (+) Transcript_41364:261-1157(+)